MDVQKDWTLIKSLFRDGVKSSGFFAIASTNPDGSPHVSPIGSLILYEPGHGVYADEFPAILSRNIAHNPRVCVMSVNSGKGFWLKSLIRGKFHNHPGIRLTGTAGKKRLGTEKEIHNWLKRVSVFRKFKGYDLLWRHMKYVRDIHFDDIALLSAGKMSAGLSE
jgi:pyridoxamine 5'-phosphate oxidase-like protein